MEAGGGLTAEDFAAYVEATFHAGWHVFGGYPFDRYAVRIRAEDGNDGFSLSPVGIIRDLIEELESDDFEQGIILGSLNSEGVTWRATNEGGSHERKDAEKYEEWARLVCDRWAGPAPCYVE